MKKNIEEWRPVLGYEGRYEVSSFGNIRTLLTDDGVPIPLKPITQGKKNRVALSGAGYKVSYNDIGRPSVRTKVRHKEIGLLVAQAFKRGNHLNERNVKHLNGNLKDNQVSNLQWTDERGL